MEISVLKVNFLLWIDLRRIPQYTTNKFLITIRNVKHR